MKRLEWVVLKWWMTAALAVLVAMLVASMPVGAQQKYAHDIKGLNFGFITFGNASEYQIAQGAWFKKFAEQEGAKVTVIDGASSPVTQVNAMDDLVAKGVDGILIQPFDAVAVAPSIQEARRAGIPVLVVGGLPDPESPVPSAVFNDEALVRQAARKAVDWLRTNKPGEKARLVLFDIPSIVVCHEWRMVAFRDEIIKLMGKENVKDVLNDFVDHTLNVAVARMEDLIQSGAKFNIFTACGGTGAIGGLDALTAAGLAGARDNVPTDVYVFSIDATPGEIAYLTNPKSSLVDTLALAPRNNARVFLDQMKGILSGAIDPDSAASVPAPGILLPKACKAISEVLADQYAIVPGYQALSCQ
ncbi:MAG: sugar ABC transporter substrate-binding protein [Lautropia sp.]|nr:sugar ABC transporter substrate-binding protein [Lautropia sp.]